MKLDDVSDEALEAHLRTRITPEIVEWMRRKAGLVSDEQVAQAPTDAAFGSAIGAQKMGQFILKDFERLLSEQQDPET